MPRFRRSFNYVLRNPGFAHGSVYVTPIRHVESMGRGRCAFVTAWLKRRSELSISDVSDVDARPMANCEADANASDHAESICVSTMPH
jgi:hypothetical protein